MASIRRELEQRAQAAILKSIITNYKKQRDDWLKEPPIRKAVLLYSFFRPANAVVIASIIILFGCAAFFIFPIALGLSAIGALAAAGAGGVLLFLLAEIAFLYLNFKNEKLHAEAVADLFEPKVKFDPATIEDKELTAKVDKALEYWSLIDGTVEKVPQGVLRDRLENTTQEVTHWLQAVYNLADRVDKFRLNKVVKQDLESVPAAIETYRRKLAEEDDPDVRRQLERTLADKERQLQTLLSLQNNMETASYQLDSTISSLGTIYSQLLLVGSKDEEGGRLSRLQEEISEQVHQLEDLTDAMDEVYQTTY